MSGEAVEVRGKKFSWPDLMNEALTAPGRMGDTYSRFYRYSMLNQLLLRMQGVNEPVATYKRWGEMGRQVLKGSKAKEILRPIQVKREDADGEEYTFTRFKMVKCLFGVSQTQGEPLPEYEPPTWDKQKALRELDIVEVKFQMLDGNTAGYSTANTVAVSPVAKYPLKTLTHELAHCVLDHSSVEFNYHQHRGIAEFEAEGSAYLVMNELEVDDAAWDAAESRSSISGWLDGQTPPDQSIKRVFSAATRILQAGRVEVGEVANG